MTKLLINALQAITNRTNLSTVLAHPNDMNAAKEMFVLLNNEGEDLIAVDIESWAPLSSSVIFNSISKSSLITFLHN